MGLSGSALAFDGRPSRLVPNTLLAIAALASAATWLTPNLYEPWLSFHGELWMTVAGLLAGAVAIVGAGAERRRLPWLAAGLFAAAGVPAIQGLTGLVRHGGDAWLTALYLVGAGFAVWAGWIAAARWGLARVGAAVLGCLLAGGAATLFLALCQWQGLELVDLFVMPGQDGLRPSGNIGQANLFATLLVLGLLAVALLFERRHIAGPTAIAAVAFLGFGIAMTQSRTALLEVVVVSVLLCWSAWRGRFGALRLPGIVVAAAIVIAMPVVWESVRHVSPFGVSARGVADVAEAGLRPLHWATLWDAALRAPWLGHGWAAVGEAQFLVAPDHAASHETLNHAHNLVLELVVVAGFPLALVMVSGLALWFWLVGRRLKDGPTAIAFGAVVAVFVHAMLEYPLHYTSFLLPTAALMGCVSQASLRGASWCVPSHAAMTLWLALAAGVAVTAVDYLSFEAERRHQRFKAANIGTPVTSWPRSDRIVLTQLGAFWNFLIEPERRGMSSAELDAMRDVVLRFPSVENMVRYAAALALNGRPDDATAVLSRACLITPFAHCRSLNGVWLALGKQNPEIAAIRWPGLPPEP